MKDDKLYLLHIGECIYRIKQYTSKGKDFFINDTKTQDAVLRNLQTLAQSTQHLSADLRSKYPEINWRGIAGFRNILVHEYLGVNLARVWKIVENDIPDLGRKIKSVLDESN